MSYTPPIRGPFFEGEVELPRSNPQLPPVSLKVKFRRTTNEWAEWVAAIERALSFGTLWTVRTIVEADSPYTVQRGDSVVLVDATDGPVTVNLPEASTVSKKRLSVKKIDATANAVTVDGDGGQTIDGGLTVSTTTQYASWDLVTDDSNWFIL